MSLPFIKIYLSGSIRKGEEDSRSDDHFWTDFDVEVVRNGIEASVEILNPAMTKIDRNDTRLNFGCDLYLVSISDLILVDLRKKKGIGVGAELMFADQMKIPTFGVLGSRSEYKRTTLTNLSGQNIQDWTHPFAEGLCDELCVDVDAACDRINTFTRSSEISAAYKEKSKASIRYFHGAAPEIVEQYD
ncbi:MAG: hypothetical protein ACRBB0_15065 [Pelagimonas sp.]|uniref:hypothetical protein n=1 Tax=Pelagimonas sp. TaxID=2073170 RepID=UPI003D6B350B